MTRRSISKYAVVVLAAVTVMAATTALTASASTSHTVIYRSDGVAAAEVQFSSGYHAGHHGPPERGFNAFIMKDLSCGDGWGAGVTWRLADGSHSQRGPADCGAEVVYETGQAGSVILEFEWRPYIWTQAGGGELREFGAWQQDWMGSDSVDNDSRWFARTTVYRDTLTASHEKPTFTVSAWPTSLTRNTDLLFMEQKWQEILTRTPLPSSLTKEQRESMKKQLWCHARYAKGGRGGLTWDLESERPNIPWWKAMNAAFNDECNW